MIYSFTRNRALCQSSQGPFSKPGSERHRRDASRHHGSFGTAQARANCLLGKTGGPELTDDLICRNEIIHEMFQVLHRAFLS